MPQRTAQHYARLATETVSYADLQDLMLEITPALGFDYFSISHYVSDPLAAGVADLSSFSEQWMAFARARSYDWKSSPIRAASRISVAGFLWDEIPNRIKLSPQQEKILAHAKQNGIGEGYTIPANIVSGVSGSVSFATKANKAAPRDVLHAAQYIGCFAFEASQRLSALTSLRTSTPPELTPRQLDCALLVARGKTDWEIGQLLNISSETAHKHIQMAMHRLGVKTRPQLVVRALFNDQISLHDALK